MSAVYPYHPDRPRNMINTSKLFDLYYAAEDSSENTQGASATTSAPTVVLTTPTRSALIKRRKTASKKPKRRVPARLKLFWDEEEVATTPSPQSTSSQQSISDFAAVAAAEDFTPDSVKLPIHSSKQELLPICLQASSVIDSNFSIPLSKTLTTPNNSIPQQHAPQNARESPQTSFVFSLPQSKSEGKQSTQEDDSLFQQTILGSFTYQHLVYVVCLGALIAYFWTQFTAQTTQITETETKTEPQIQTLEQIQTRIDSVQFPYFPSSSFTIASATLTPSLSAVRIFVAQHRSQFSFTVLRARRLFAR